MLINKLFTKPEIPHNTPENTRIYAIGDIHGNLEPLLSLHEIILKEEKNFNPEARKVLVYLGDYVDRRLESKQVIEHLITSPLPGFERIFLKGNHEHAMLEFIEGPERSEQWFLWGGEATIQSYGVKLDVNMLNQADLEKIAKELESCIPEHHKKFFSELKMMHEEGDYVFVHAGFRPGIPLDQQSGADMLMIRDEFIYSRKDFGKTIVFGHTIFDKPFIGNGRIGIDTGSFATGKLTAVMLQGKVMKFLSTRE